jgi:hypothetical protein
MMDEDENLGFQIAHIWCASYWNISGHRRLSRKLWSFENLMLAGGQGLSKHQALESIRSIEKEKAQVGCMMAQVYNSRRLGQEDHDFELHSKFKANLGYLVKPCLKKKKGQACWLIPNNPSYSGGRYQRSRGS